ncbi:unnamed protein product [Lymnaea stagnalis]|uniref:DM2 domain-containing protein n=1 Tax=Lymnaea stagnalis TaxID=6523 RepID=A0AAV2I9W6_LYMST
MVSRALQAQRFVQIINQQLEILKEERNTMTGALDECINQVQSEVDVWVNRGHVEQTTCAEMSNRIQQVITLFIEKSVELSEKVESMNSLNSETTEYLAGSSTDAKRPTLLEQLYERRNKSVNSSNKHVSKKRNLTIKEDDSDVSSIEQSESRKHREKKPYEKKKTSLYSRPCHLSDLLAAVVGKSEMSRQDVLKTLWSIVKARNLQDPDDKQFMLCDAQMEALFGRKKVNLFGMMKYLKQHITDLP